MAVYVRGTVVDTTYRPDNDDFLVELAEVPRIIWCVEDERLDRTPVYGDTVAILVGECYELTPHNATYEAESFAFFSFPFSEPFIWTDAEEAMFRLHMHNLQPDRYGLPEE